MRYNEYQSDPFSEANPCKSIAARCDLSPVYSLGGAIDSKVTSYENIVGNGDVRTAWGINGPTYQDQAVFSWEDWKGTVHYGQPEEFNFDWELFGQ